jgi:hypothetical protein
MNHHILQAALLSFSLLATPLTHAHDPALHAQEAAEAKKGPECAKLDHSNMKANDPVAQALMAKCGIKPDAHAEHSEAAPAPAKPAVHGGHQP